VVLGHFFQRMVEAELLSMNDLCKWFNQTIYYFHVPLFLFVVDICIKSKVVLVPCKVEKILKNSLH
jgi:hypothetical protein